MKWRYRKKYKKYAGIFWNKATWKDIQLIKAYYSKANIKPEFKKENITT